MKYVQASFALLSLLSAACAPPSGGDGKADPVGAVKEPERWSRADDPGIFGIELERNFARLPARGTASPLPWTGTYWPASRDSINYHWAGANTLSPSEKYGMAFGVYGVDEMVSRQFGIEARGWSPFCFDDSQCDRGRHEVCGVRAWQAMGRCIPFWDGICDGWCSAAITFPEPQHAVVMNGVTFRVQDIKALLSLLQVSAPKRFVSLKCTLSDEGGGIRYDNAGRPLELSCRDTNPGTYHLLLTNYLGLRGKSFVEDRTFDIQVWNQPIVGYQILEQREVGAADANTLVAGVGPARYLFDDIAHRFAYVKNEVSYIQEARADVDGNLASSLDWYTRSDTYEYLLEMDGAGSIIGGEWVGTSKRRHPDFVWIPTGVGTAVAGGAIRYAQVAALAAASVAPVAVGTAARR
jgi:hypothetical protein